MYDWQVLKKNDIPSDILTGNYEFRIQGDNGRGWVEMKDSRVSILSILYVGIDEIQYRRSPAEDKENYLMRLRNVYDKAESYDIPLVIFEALIHLLKESAATPLRCGIDGDDTWHSGEEAKRHRAQHYKDLRAKYDEEKR